MEKTEAWLAPHEESTAELGAIRFAGRMPPKYRWLIISGGAAAIFILLGLIINVGSTSQPLPPGDGPLAKKAAGERSVAVVMSIASPVVGLCFLAGGFAIYRSFMTGSYSLHEQGAMSIVWGKTARLRYQDVDELTVRSQRVYVNGAYIGAAQWVTLASTTVDAPPVRFCHVTDSSSGCKDNAPIAPAVVTNLCGGIAAQIAERIHATLARGETYALTCRVGLTPSGVVIGKGSRAKTLAWSELDRLTIKGGTCFLYRRGEKQSVSRWLFETKNCMPVCVVIERLLNRSATGVGDPGTAAHV
jgi:hypothetical protein